MPITGGVFTPIWQWVVDVVTYPNMQPTRFDTYGNDVASAINTARFKDGSNAPTANLPMAGFVHTGVGNATARTSYPALGQVQDNKFSTAADTGSADAYAITLVPAITSYTTGQAFWVRVANTNTGASTLNVNGVGVKTIKWGAADLVAGQLISGRTYIFYYDGTNFQLVSSSSIIPDNSITTSMIADKAVTLAKMADNTANRLLGYNNTGVSSIYTATAPINFASGTVSVSDASTSAKGVVQLATSAEVATGTDASKAVTPATLGSFGFIPRAGSSFVGGASPSLTRSLNIASITRPSVGVYTVTFTNAVATPYLVVANSGQPGGGDGNPNFTATAFNRTSTGFTLRTGQPGSSTNTDNGVNDFIVI